MKLTPRDVGLRALVVGAAFLAPVSVQAQTDVAGTWMMEVSTDNGVTTPSMTLEQDGATLTGRYSSDTLGETNLRGTVEGSRVTITLAGNLQGQSIPVTYEGTVDDAGVMSGTIDIADGMLTGTFTASRS